MDAINEIPIWKKNLLSVDEAAAYFSIGVNKLREITKQKDCPFVLWVGNRRLIKRRKLEEYLEEEFSI